MSSTGQTSNELVKVLGEEYTLDFATNRELDQPRPGMVIVSMNRACPFEVTLEWLLEHLPAAPAEQFRNARLVVVTDPNARLAQVLKNDADVDDFLEIHTAAIG